MSSQRSESVTSRLGVRYRLVLMAAVTISGCALAWPAAAQLRASPAALSAPVAPRAVTVDLKSLTAEPKAATVPEGEREPVVVPIRPQPLADPVIQSGAEVQRDAIGLISAPVVNVAGINANANPPDTVGDVGRNHYVQMVNATQFQIFDKQGNALTGALNFGALWNAVGGNCTGNLGDPIVVYDHLADRWLLSQFANPNHMCIAISQTPDPTAGTWFLYEFNTGDFPDYQKFGVWRDGYYMSTFEGALGIYVFDRANMLLGNAAQFFKTTLANPAGPNRNTRILPADLDGPAPPDGTPNYFVRSVDDLQDNADPNDRIEIYEARVDWLNLTFTFTLVDDLRAAQGLAPFNTMACNRNGGGIRDCIPQPTAVANTDTIDALSNRPMMQLRFRTFGSDQRMVFNQTIDVSGSIPNSLNITPAGEVAGVRWYELSKTAANWAIRQQGTYAPQPNNATAENQLLHRWMGSAAMDKHGNIAMGYSITNADNANPIFPGIRYTGRRFDDVLGLMPQGEQVILNGTNAQTQGLGARWGDYSTMSVDPADDCTFWFTNHVAGAGGGGARPTRIASFRFDTCGTDLAIQKTANPGPIVAGDQLVYTVTVVNNGPDTATRVTVVDTLPAGVTYLANTDACVATLPTLTCTLPDLAAGASTSFDIKVRVSPGLTATSGPTTITNTATVSADQADPNPSNNNAAVTTLIEELADLRITKLCKPDTGPAPAGSTATCTIVVDNLGPSDARNVVVTDTHLGSGSFSLTAATFVSTSPAASGNCAIASGVVTCDLARENAGGRTTITVELTANGSVDVNDFATVASATPDPNLANNAASGAVSFQGAADLRLTKTDSPDPVTAGQVLTYSLTVQNLGPSPAPNVVVRDVLPKEVALVSATPSQGACAGTTVPGDPAQPLTCTLNTMANGASATITVVVAVKPDTGPGAILINNASVASGYPDPNNANNVSTASTTVQTRADLGIVKTSDADTYKPSSRITYRIDATNNGPSVARAVVVTDNLPDVKQALYQSDTGSCVRNSATNPTMLRCELGDLAVGESRTFFVTLLVRGNKGVVSNTASVASGTTDPNNANNSSTKSVTVGK